MSTRDQSTDDPAIGVEASGVSACLFVVVVH
jgi:hypothetical protein